MKFYAKLDDDILGSAENGLNPVTRIDARRYSNRPLQVQFWDNGVPTILDDPVSVIWSVKNPGDYLGSELITCELDAPETASGFYSAKVSYDSAELDAIFLGTGNAQKASISLLAQLTYLLADGSIGKSQCIALLLGNAFASSPVVLRLREDGGIALREDGGVSLPENGLDVVGVLLREDGGTGLREDGGQALRE